MTIKVAKDTFPKNLSGVHVHFVGIKGTGMAALVEIFHARGAVITGSDVAERFYTDDILERLSLRVLPFSEKNITKDIQFVVHSSAYSVESNPDLAEAKRRGIPLMLYSQALGALSAQSYSCSVCGVHGKTTTTGLIGTILRGLNLPSQVLAGSIISSFGGTCTMTSDSYGASGRHYFVAETCEYQRHFLSFHPQKILLTSVESDHQDYYPTYADIRQAFVEYIWRLPIGGQLLYCADDSGAVETAGLSSQFRRDIQLLPYGTNASGNYHLELGRVEDGKQYFTMGVIGECALSVPGVHNVRNACAAVALCSELLRSEGKNPAAYATIIKAMLLQYSGGKRRSEVIAHAKTPLGQDVIVLDDYAHHPTAIKSTLKGYREFYQGRKIIVDFMSHTYSRTAALLEDFATGFADADRVIVNKIYASARELASEPSVTGEFLAKRADMCNHRTTYAAEFDEAARLVLAELSKPSGDGYPNGYLFVTMGAGDNWKVGRMVVEALAANA